MTTADDIATTQTTADGDVTSATTTTTLVDDDGSIAMIPGMANYQAAAKELAAVCRVLEPQKTQVAAKELAATCRVLEPQIIKTEFGENRWRDPERPTDESSIKAPSWSQGKLGAETPARAGSSTEPERASLAGPATQLSVGGPVVERASLAGPATQQCKSRRVKFAADCDFDELVRMHWRAHLGAMRPELAKTKNVGGTYYRLWLQDLDLNKECADAKDCDSPVVVLKRDRVFPTAESTEELPPGAEDDRQARPAEHRQHQQGGLAQSKLVPAEFTPWQVMRARKNFAYFWQRP